MKADTDMLGCGLIFWRVLPCHFRITCRDNRFSTRLASRYNPSVTYAAMYVSLRS
jgi:hypothetical protein